MVGILSHMPFRTEHHQYNMQIAEPGKYPDVVAPFKVFEGDRLMAVVRQCDHDIIDIPEERGFDFRVDCHAASKELRAYVDAYFPNFKVVYLEHGTWTWKDNGTYEKMPW
jgi:hypothetical protein